MALVAPQTRSFLNFISFLAPDNIPYILFTPKDAPPDFPQNHAEIMAAIEQCPFIAKSSDAISISPDLQESIRDEIPISQESLYINSILQKFDRLIPQEIDFNPEAFPLCAQLATHIVAVSKLSEKAAKVASLLHRLGHYYLVTADYPLAETYLRKSIQILQTSVCMITLAELFKILNRPADAEPLLKKALHLAPDAFIAARVKGALGLLLTELNRAAEAEPVLNESLQISESSPYHAIHSSYLAFCMQATGKTHQAETLFTKAIDQLGSLLGKDNPKIADASIRLAMLYLQLKRPADAEPLLNTALCIQKTTLGLDHPACIQTKTLLDSLNSPTPEISAFKSILNWVRSA